MIPYSIRAVSKRTGLTQHTIRAWEKRYQVLDPDRTSTNRRLYSESDVRKLLLLKEVMSHGHSIGQIAHLDTSELSGLISGDGSAPRNAGPSRFSDPADLFVQQITLDAKGDSGSISEKISLATASLGVESMIKDVVVPAVRWIMDRDNLTEAQSQSAVRAVRNSLAQLKARLDQPDGCPVAIAIETPSCSRSLSDLTVPILASLIGWKVLFVHPDHGVSGLAATANSACASAICLLSALDGSASHEVEEIAYLRKTLSPGTRILVQAEPAVVEPQLFRDQDLTPFESVESLGQRLREISSPTPIVGCLLG